MDRNVQKIGLINTVIFLLLGAVAFAGARYGGSLAGQTAAIFIVLGFLIAAVSWFQMRLAEQERLEKLEYDELSRRASSGSLFNQTPDSESLPAQGSREQFERFLVPAFTVVLCGLCGAGLWWSWRMSDQVGAGHELKELPVLGTFAFCFLVAFLLGKYSATAARLEKIRLLRPGAGYLLLTAYLSLAVVAGVVFVWAGFPSWDYYVARGLSALLGVIGVETLVSLLLELYRPRVQGKIGRPLYESRLVGLLGTPEGLITTAAQAVDYQFGFKVSETWFYQFLVGKRLAWLLLLQLGILLLSTCVVFIEPGEQGVLERFGSPVASRPVLDPGPHLKFPWPMDQVYRFHTREVQSLNVGFEPDPARANERTVLWTVPHYKEEFNLLVASGDTLTLATNQSGERIAPVNLLTVGLPVQYEITNVLSWAYKHDDAAKLLGQIALRETVRYLASVDLFDVMSGGQLAGAEELRRRIQAHANERELGVNVLFVGLHDIHPPTSIAESFQGVVSAQQDVQANILRAQGLAVRTTLVAQAEAKARVNAARAEALRRVAGSAATAAQFTNQIAAYNASPEVYQTWMLMQTLKRAGANARKFIITPTNAAVYQLNLEEKSRPDLLDLSVPPPK